MDLLFKYHEGAISVQLRRIRSLHMTFERHNATLRAVQLTCQFESEQEKSIRSVTKI